MIVKLELNQKYGKGYQVRVIYGPVDEVYDKEQLNLYEAAQHASTVVDILNKEFKTEYKPEDVIRITEEGLEANKGYDFGSAQMMKDIDSRSFNLVKPEPTPDIKYDENGEMYFSARGLLLFTYITWQEEQTEPAKKFLMKYCQLLASHKYGKGATQIFNEMDRLDKDSGCEWIRETYAKYVHDDMEIVSIYQ